MTFNLLAGPTGPSGPAGSPAPPIAIVTTGTTSYNLTAVDNGKIIYFTASTAVSLNVPAGLGAAFEIGMIQGDAGAVTPTPSGTTINNRQSHTVTAGQYSFASLTAVAADDLVFAGDTA